MEFTVQCSVQDKWYSLCVQFYLQHLQKQQRTETRQEPKKTSIVAPTESQSQVWYLQVPYTLNLVLSHHWTTSRQLLSSIQYFVSSRSFICSFILSPSESVTSLFAIPAGINYWKWNRFRKFDQKKIFFFFFWWLVMRYDLTTYNSFCSRVIKGFVHNLDIDIN